MNRYVEDAVFWAYKGAYHPYRPPAKDLKEMLARLAFEIKRQINSPWLMDERREAMAQINLNDPEFREYCKSVALANKVEPKKRPTQGQVYILEKHGMRVPKTMAEASFLVGKIKSGEKV